MPQCGKFLPQHFWTFWIYYRPLAPSHTVSWTLYFSVTELSFKSPVRQRCALTAKQALCLESSWISKDFHHQLIFSNINSLVGHFPKVLWPTTQRKCKNFKANWRPWPVWTCHILSRFIFVVLLNVFAVHLFPKTSYFWELVTLQIVFLCT